MKSLLFAFGILALAWIFFFVEIFKWYPRLPEHVATHFDWAGHPNGWMSRAAHLKILIALGLGAPVFIAAICYATRFIPAAFVNIPNREYWLAPERRAQTSTKLFRHGILLAAIMTAFITGVHLLIVGANLAVRPGVSPTAAETVYADFVAPASHALIGAFVVAIAVWTVALVLEFRRPKR